MTQVSTLSVVVKTIAISVALLAVSSPGAEVLPPPRPNFIIILTDDQGYGDLGCFGGTHVRTPHIDKMAREGARLTNFYVSAPICTPSRASLMTGSYPKRVGMAERVNLAADPKGLNPEEITIAEVLRAAGYRTGMVGKWHLGDQPEFMPTRQGFEYFYGLPYSHDVFPRHATRIFPPLPLLDGEEVVELNPYPALLTKRFTQKALAFVDENQKVPFFLYLAHPMPHRPVYVSPDFMEPVPEGLLQEVQQEDAKPKMGKARDKLYPFAISEIDWSVGQVLKALEDHGIADNTFVIFTSDNGPKIGSSKPLSGGKGSTLEGGMRMPTVVRWPAGIAAGSENGEVMTTMDLLPTFANLAGAELPSDRVIDGKDVSLTLQGEANSPHEFFLYYNREKVSAIRKGKWKYHLNGRPGRKGGSGGALFNLEEDAAEKNNLIKQHPEIAQELRAEAQAYDKNLSKDVRPAAFAANPKALTLSKSDGKKSQK